MPESPHAATFNVDDLHCYGCAHSAAGEPFPSRPSGERPCCVCIRNPDREEWEGDAKMAEAKAIHVKVFNAQNEEIGEDWREFNPFHGRRYDGTPYVYNPIDNYVTLDQRDQEALDDEHPEWGHHIKIVHD